MAVKFDADGAGVQCQWVPNSLSCPTNICTRRGRRWRPCYVGKLTVLGKTYPAPDRRPYSLS